MGHSRTPTQNTAGDGFPADPIGGSRALGAVQRQPRIVTILLGGKHLPNIRGARSGKQTCGLVPERAVRSGPCAGCVIRWRAVDWLVHGKAASLSRGLTAEAGFADSAPDCCLPRNPDAG
jgi:hypothetical protein